MNIHNSTRMRKKLFIWGFLIAIRSFFNISNKSCFIHGKIEFASSNGLLNPLETSKLPFDLLITSFFIFM